MPDKFETKSGECLYLCSSQWSTQITYLQCIVQHSDHPAPARETRLLWNT